MLHKRGCCPLNTSNHTRSGRPRCRQEVPHSRRSTPTQTGPRRTSSRRPILCNAWCSRSVCYRSTCRGISPTDVASCPWRIDRPRILNQSNIRWTKFNQMKYSHLGALIPKLRISIEQKRTYTASSFARDDFPNIWTKSSTSTGLLQNLPRPVACCWFIVFFCDG